MTETTCSSEERDRYGERLFSILTAHLSLEPDESPLSAHCSTDRSG